MLKFIRHLTKDQAGATAIEYAIVAASIAVVIVGAVAVLGSQTVGMFGEAGSALAPSTP